MIHKVIIYIMSHLLVSNMFNVNVAGSPERHDPPALVSQRGLSAARLQTLSLAAATTLPPTHSLPKRRLGRLSHLEQLKLWPVDALFLSHIGSLFAAGGLHSCLWPDTTRFNE